VCIEQPLLTFKADLRQHDLPTVAQQLLIVHGGKV